MQPINPSITSSTPDGDCCFVANIGVSRQGLGQEAPDADISCTAAASIGQGRLAVASRPSLQNVCGQCGSPPSAQFERSLHAQRLLDIFSSVHGCTEAKPDAGTATAEFEPRLATMFGPASLYCDPMKRKSRKHGLLEDEQFAQLQRDNLSGITPLLTDIFGMQACQSEAQATGASIGAAEATLPASRHSLGHVCVQLQEDCDSQPIDSVGEAVHPSDPTLADIFGPLSEEEAMKVLMGGGVSSHAALASATRTNPATRRPAAMRA